MRESFAKLKSVFATCPKGVTPTTSGLHLKFGIRESGILMSLAKQQIADNPDDSNEGWTDMPTKILSELPIRKVRQELKDLKSKGVIKFRKREGIRQMWLDTDKIVRVTEVFSKRHKGRTEKGWKEMSMLVLQMWAHDEAQDMELNFDDIFRALLQLAEDGVMLMEREWDGSVWTKPTPKGRGLAHGLLGNPEAN